MESKPCRKDINAPQWKSSRAIRPAIIVLIAICVLFLMARQKLSAAEDDDPVLKEASISFHTNDDNRDHDTRIDVSFYKDDEEYAKADNIDWNTEFKDNSDKGPYALRVLGRVKKGDVKGSRTKIVITPNGHDTWKFNFKVVLTFSDGSTKFQEISAVSLNERKSEGSWRW